MKILLTGANGFIGSHLVNKLLSLNHQLFVLKRKKSDLSRIKQYVKDITFYDYEDSGSIARAFNNSIDIVVHAAGVYVKNEQNESQVKAMNDFNIDCASQLLFHANQERVKGFINTGTFFEYDLTQTQPINEGSLIKPFNYYAATKLAFEHLLKYISSKGTIKGVTLKLFSPYGPMDNDKVIPLIIKSFLLQKQLVLSSSMQKLSFTYIDDVIRAYLCAIDYIANSESHYEDFVIGQQSAYSIREIATFVEEISHKKNMVSYENSLHNRTDQISVSCDARKAQTKLLWTPTTEIREGLQETCQYFEKVI